MLRTCPKLAVGKTSQELRVGISLNKRRSTRGHVAKPLTVVLTSALLLAGCADLNDAADNIARDQAKSVVNGVVEDRLPGVNVAPVTDCIIDQASAGEILSLARASVAGVDEGTVRQVLEIAQRPEAVECIARNGLGLLSL